MPPPAASSKDALGEHRMKRKDSERKERDDDLPTRGDGTAHGRLENEKSSDSLSEPESRNHKRGRKKSTVPETTDALASLRQLLDEDDAKEHQRIAQGASSCNESLARDVWAAIEEREDADDVEEEQSISSGDEPQSLSDQEDDGLVPEDLEHEMPEYAQQPLMASQQLDSLVKQGNKFALELERGYRNLLRLIYDIEMASGKIGLKGRTFKQFWKWGSYCLAQTHSCILRGVIAGDIFERYLGNKDKDLVDALRLLLHHGDWMPGFYRVSLVNSRGESPKIKQLLIVLDLLERYCDPKKFNSKEDKAFAFRMGSVKSDYWQPEWTEKGWRRYLQPDSIDREEMNLPKGKKCDDMDRTPVQRKIDRLLEYIGIQRAQLLKEVDHEKRLVRPLSYTGWSKTPTSRIKAHQSHNSNLPMSATDACFRATYPHSTTCLRGIVLSFVCKEEHAFVGEIIWTCAGQTNMSDGAGFNIASA
ncbi:hypothetical protein LTS18_007734 [Coniosporium uncinatum]|uniref:Uncharacterized protein n=1 Tax=Coniosporium uncinatum TaxID=93489 RepID=A0ACC3DXL1_9PEZI|nr:hypothetical protein LTS18_007734 [Coniosporium uncinatum]